MSYTKQETFPRPALPFPHLEVHFIYLRGVFHLLCRKISSTSGLVPNLLCFLFSCFVSFFFFFSFFLLLLIGFGFLLLLLMIVFFLLWKYNRVLQGVAGLTEEPALSLPVSSAWRPVRFSTLMASPGEKWHLADNCDSKGKSSLFPLPQQLLRARGDTAKWYW